MHKDLRKFINNPTPLTWHVAQTCRVKDKPMHELVGKYKGEHPNVEQVKRLANG